MGKIILGIIVTILVSSTSISAQLRPQIENEVAKSLSLGPTIDDEGLKWNIQLDIKKENVSEIIGYEINGAKKISRFQKKQNLQLAVRI